MSTISELSTLQRRISDSLWFEELPYSPARSLPPRPSWYAVGELTPAQAEAGIHVRLTTSANGGEVIASATLLPADNSPFADAATRAAGLDQCVCVCDLGCRPGDEARLGTLLYVAGRRARIMGRINLLVAVRDGAAEECALLDLRPLKHLPALARKGSEFQLYAQRLDIVMHRLARDMAARGVAVPSEMMAGEIAETNNTWIAASVDWPFFAAVSARRLAREQYVYGLQNIYQFVRHSTRLLAECIAQSTDPLVRRHFIAYLNGEVNHEVIIENDLRHLGEDVEYTIDHMVPNQPLEEYMCIQESRLGYNRDITSFLASPLAAEGLTAHLGPQFANDLEACVASWGVRHPARAAKFFTSHIKSDGGEQGHYLANIRFLTDRIPDERTLQTFLVTSRASRSTVARYLNSFVEDLEIWTRP